MEFSWRFQWPSLEVAYLAVDYVPLTATQSSHMIAPKERFWEMQSSYEFGKKWIRWVPGKQGPFFKSRNHSSPKQGMLIAFLLASQHLAHLPRLTWDSETGKRGEGRRENGIRMEVRKEEQRERGGRKGSKWTNRKTQGDHLRLLWKCQTWICHDGVKQ